MSLASDKAAYLAGEMTTEEYEARNASEIRDLRARGAATRAAQAAYDAAHPAAPTSTATFSMTANKIFAVVVLVIAFVLVIAGTSKYAWHAPKTNDCYNNGITIMHGTAYHGSCDPNGPPSTHPDGTN